MQVVPLKFVFPSHVDESYIETGVASVKLQLTNMRADYLLYLFTSNWEGYNYYTSDFGVGVYSGYLSYPKQVGRWGLGMQKTDELTENRNTNKDGGKAPKAILLLLWLNTAALHYLKVTVCC